MLVARRCWEKIAAGHYELLPAGARLRSRVLELVDVGVGASATSRLLEVHRPATRPEPRQLVRFRILTLDGFACDCAEAMYSPASEITRLLRSLSLYCELVIRAEDGGWTIEGPRALRNRILRHSLVSCVKGVGSWEIHLGLDAIEVAIAAAHAIWPPSVAPFGLEFRHTDAIEARQVGRQIEEWALCRGWAVESGLGVSDESFAPVSVTITDGDRPCLVRSLHHSIRCRPSEVPVWLQQMVESE
jgi:hypothetical protein